MEAELQALISANLYEACVVICRDGSDVRHMLSSSLCVAQIGRKTKREALTSISLTVEILVVTMLVSCLES